jgi:hypothetical protein
VETSTAHLGKAGLLRSGQGTGSGKADHGIPQALSTDSVERLPVYNKSAWRHYQTIQEAGDWCVPSTEPKNTSTYRIS